jgi:hypothetical protein
MAGTRLYPTIRALAQVLHFVRRPPTRCTSIENSLASCSTPHSPQVRGSSVGAKLGRTIPALFLLLSRRVAVQGRQVERRSGNDPRIPGKSLRGKVFRQWEHCRSEVVIGAEGRVRRGVADYLKYLTLRDERQLVCDNGYSIWTDQI